MKVREIVKKAGHQAGVTILEFIAFIGLAALVIAGALGLYSSANTGAQSTDLVQVANGVVATMRQTYAASAVSSWVEAAKNTSAGPTGWTQVNNAFSKNGRTITVGGTSGTMEITINAGDAKICKSVENSNVGGEAVNTKCNAANEAKWTGIKP